MRRFRFGFSVLSVFCFLFVAPLSRGGEPAVLKAGVAKVEITPTKPVQMSGYASRKGLSTDVHDPLSARALAFAFGGKRLVLVSTDLIGFYGGTAEYLREAILDECDLKPSELFLSAIHTHAGPTLTIDKEKGHPNNLAYTLALKDKLIAVIRAACENLEPVEIGTGVGYCPVGSNRRELRVTREGESSIVLGRNPYGPTDKEVLVMKVARPDGAPVAAAFDYATHATCLGGKNYTISGDVIGLAEQFAEKILGSETVAPAFAGASGNIDPWFRVLPAFNTEPGWVPEPVLLGTFLGEEVVHVYRDISRTSSAGVIGTAFATLQLPAKPSEDAAGKNPDPVPFNVTVGRLGDVAFVGLGGEVLTEIGLAIKAGSPCACTFVITHCNGAAGYLAPKHLHVEGGYEIRSTAYAPQAADVVVRQSIRMLHDL
ncbi:MAG: neutral/alkaline non-lysosomal ceramidase N-terminal domain-containing protein [Sedimentisphaerales bacterium]|nr:neutral/alkaline non-lysosomal ceramidase N-terminal domain-containing protein [Sedimentisphaerales bacterium]